MRKHTHFVKDIKGLAGRLGVGKLIILSKSYLVNQDVGSTDSSSNAQMLDVGGNPILDTGGDSILDVSYTPSDFTGKILDVNGNEILDVDNDAIIDVDGVEGSNTEVIWTWDGEIKKDDIFYHSNSVSPSRVEVTEEGWYAIDFIGSVMQTGVGRATLQGMYRINGGTTKYRGTIRSYTEGAAYGNCSPSVNSIVELSAGDYVEVGTNVEYSDAVYTMNTSGSEISEDSHIFTMRKVGL